MYIPHCVENGQVPKFLLEIWEKKHGSDPVADYQAECDKEPNGGITFMAVVCLLASIVIIADTKDLNIVFGYRIMIGLALMLAATCFFVWRIRLPDWEDGNGHRCYSSLGRLFIEFGIKPSKEIGKMGMEEFRGFIEDALTCYAKRVDTAVGFEKINTRDEFNDMHKIALEWNLCHESHAHYYPNKKALTKS